jgi:small subunit ribosomal protein S9
MEENLEKKPVVKSRTPRKVTVVQGAEQKQAVAKAPHKEDAGPVYRAVGRRKCAIARIRMTLGDGTIIVNEKDFKTYFPTFILQRNVELPLTLTNSRTEFTFSIKVLGGGSNGQSEAVRHGITRALVLWNPELKKTMRSEGLMTRDPRVKERKKPGLKRARRAPQFSKR